MVFCDCRDCFDVAKGLPGALCDECSEAGCTRQTSMPNFMAAYGLGMECQRRDAYGVGETSKEYA